MGIEPATFRLVAQRLNQLRYRVPPMKSVLIQKQGNKQNLRKNGAIQLTNKSRLNEKNEMYAFHLR